MTGLDSQLKFTMYSLFTILVHLIKKKGMCPKEVWSYDETCCTYSPQQCT